MLRSINMLQLIYPVEEPQRQRTIDMEVLCLGYSRSGTDSLMRALYALGYKKVYHGTLAGRSQPGDCLSWIKLGLQRSRSPSTRSGGTARTVQSITRKQLDAIIGDCDCVTDLPVALFGAELLDAYPNARVILNKRRDVDAWARSWEATIEATALNWSSALISLFDAEMFWVVRSFQWAVKEVRHSDSDSDSDSSDTNRSKKRGIPSLKECYHEHFRKLERKMEADGRKWLDWTVQEGWDPLCAWLDKEMPLGEEFPSGNAIEEWREKTADEIFKPKVLRAVRNVVILAVAVIAIGVSAGIRSKAFL